MSYRFAVFHSITELNEQDWQRLAYQSGPFVSYAFLHKLEQTQCVSAKNGWRVAHLGLYKEDALICLVPGYIKQHSYGEYVFDQGWAEAYQQHGLSYYPKWISAVPFTPVSGPRLLYSAPLNAEALSFLCQGLTAWLRQHQISSQHWLFLPEEQQQALTHHGYLTRRSVQFEWFNRHYTCYDDFTACLTSRKRRSIRKARASIAANNIDIRRLTGDAITPEAMDFFIQCYQQTYLKRSGHTGYLSAEFFHGVLQKMRDNLLIVSAYCNDQALASALLFFDQTGLYGRYWGCVEEVSELHFECCYYQGIEFAIERALPKFNPGTQGEHKILRGFEPIYCYSSHQLMDGRFHAAVADFLHKENKDIEAYYHQAQDVLPFNQAYLEEYISTIKK
jgi:predicted N-acyltransferase